MQTAAATLGGIAAPSPLENYGFEWFHSGVRVARVASRRVALRPLVAAVVVAVGGGLAEKSCICEPQASLSL